MTSSNADAWIIALNHADEAAQLAYAQRLPAGEQVPKHHIQALIHAVRAAAPILARAARHAPAADSSVSVGPRGRGLEYARLESVAEDGSPVLECMCDCGVVTHVKLVGPAVGSVEVAYTCDGCESSHWLTVSIVEREER